MKILDRTAEELFNKIRSKFSHVTIGNENSEVTSDPSQARYFNFKFKSQQQTLGDVNIALEEKRGLTIIYSKDFIKDQPDLVKNEWYDFLKDMRKFAIKRLLKFDVRDTNKTNLNIRDFDFLKRQNHTSSGDNSKMNESAMYGTNKTSYQRIGNARLCIKHSAPINNENVSSRTQKIGTIFIESPSGEKFRYPYRHLSGARAMAQHVSEGGTAYDDFGKYISSLSEELSKLRKFSTYMNRNGVMAETLSKYTDIVKERAVVIRKEIQNLQKPNYYKETIQDFSVPIVEQVPDDVTENWIDQLTIRQFNEELKDVFPYIYRLVGEANRVEELNPEDVEEQSDPCWDGYKMVGTKKKGRKTVPNCVPESEDLQVSSPHLEANLNFENRIEEYFENLMGNFSNKTANENLSDESNALAKEHIWLKFTHKRTAQEKIPYLVAYAGFSSQPEDLKYDESIRQYHNLKNIRDIENVTTQIMKDQVFLNVKKIYIYDQHLNNPLLDRFYEWFYKNYTGNDIQIFSKPITSTVSQDPASKTTSADIWIQKLNKVVTVGTGSFVVLRKIHTKLTDFKQSVSLLRTGDEVRIIDGEYTGYSGVVQELNIKQEKEKGSADSKPYANIKPKDHSEPKRNETITFRISPKFFGNVVLKDPNFEWVKKHQRRQFSDFVMSKQQFERFKTQAEASTATFKKRGTDKIVKLEPQIQIIKVAESQFKKNQKKSKTPLGEYILSYFDRNTRKFPKGATAVLTAVEKNYGDKYVEPARQFIEQIEATTSEYMQQTTNQPILAKT